MSSSSIHLQLGVNTGFALNRFPEHEEWARVIGEVLGLRSVQFTAEMLNPYLPDDVIKRHIKEINENLERYHVSVHSTFTGAYTRVNHLAHPDSAVRKYWVEWFKKYADITVALGADAMGSHFGILSSRDVTDSSLRKERLKQNIECWKEIAVYAKDAGVEYLMWEPMSVPREYGETLESATSLQKLLDDADFAIPMKMCLDVDHGDVSSTNSDDTNPYSWLERFGAISPCVHLKQSLQDKNGFRPFTQEYNKIGKVRGDAVLDSLAKSGAKNVALMLELSFREREPYESNVLSDLKASVDYWRKWVKE
ncbi:TPA: TIM barrel protein [Candidatus Micrarchaeota archaeon]|nr:TIM barrel protein [Candidatus Micrarchaeota archaeon]